MKRFIAFVMVALVCFTLVACAGEGVSETDALNLEGTWTQVNANEGETYQQAVIEGDTITVNWVFSDGEMIYWVGTYLAPSTAEDSYSWTSEGDTETMGTSMLASSDSTKLFEYKDEILTFEVEMMGTSTTVAMMKS